MIYLIEEHNFDSMENREPCYDKIIGYFESEDTAIEYVERFNNSLTYEYEGVECKRFKSAYSEMYSKNLYPYLSYMGVNQM